MFPLVEQKKDCRNNWTDVIFVRKNGIKKDILYNSPLGKNNIRCERITFSECIRGGDCNI